LEPQESFSPDSGFLAISTTVYYHFIRTTRSLQSKVGNVMNNPFFCSKFTRHLESDYFFCSAKIGAMPATALVKEKIETTALPRRVAPRPGSGSNSY
jgi:hypothetical protein